MLLAMVRVFHWGSAWLIWRFVMQCCSVRLRDNIWFYRFRLAFGRYPVQI